MDTNENFNSRSPTEGGSTPNGLVAEKIKAENFFENANQEMPSESIQSNLDSNLGPDITDDDDELEEGELKDDDDDDDEDDFDTVDGTDNTKSVSKTNGDPESDEVVSVKSAKSSSSSSSSKDSKPSKEEKASKSSRKNSSSSSDDESSSRHSLVRSSRSRRTSTNQHAQLLTRRAKLLEAKSREIEMKFQKIRSSITSSPSISVISSAGSIHTRLSNLRTTHAKPPITYAENPNPRSVSPVSRLDKKSKKRKKKSSPKKKKRSKTEKFEKPDKNEKHEKVEKTDSAKKSKSHDNAIEAPCDVDHQGPRTPPDNQVLSLDDEQIEWPSYLIKMTITQPSISYSVNPASVMEPSQQVQCNDTADLNSDYYWYYNYFLSMEMSKAQAHHQACCLVISSGNYDEQKLDRFLEQRGFIRQSTSPKLDNDEADKLKGANSGVQHRTTEPSITTLRLNREIILPNGKVLPRGTIQKIVHPFPRTDRVVPDIRTPYFDMN